jgi:hypothetical protein
MKSMNKLLVKSMPFILVSTVYQLAISGLKKKQGKPSLLRLDTIVAWPVFSPTAVAVTLPRTSKVSLPMALQRLVPSG